MQMVALHKDITIGQKRRTVELPGVRLIEATYPGGLFVPPHSHTTANATIILTGELSETSQGCTRQCRPGSVVLKPAGTIHSNKFSPSGARTLVIEVLANEASVPSFHSALGWDYHWVSSGALTRAMVHLFQAFRGRDPEILNAEVDGVFDFLCGEVGAGSQPLPVAAPLWLKDLKTLIDESVARPLRVGELAKLAGTHPVYLTRVFRRFHGTGVGEYIHRRRATHVASMLTQSNSPLKEIANSSGFADQAHMTRVFKSQMGITPGAFRQLLR